MAPLVLSQATQAFEFGADALNGGHVAAQYTIGSLS
ncbi:monooxygenase [Corynebacterium glutamicum ZL-2]|nr:monooxygenase [[Brevibacterium] flavum ZL-1]PST76518.1 monooxygenase [Corynebacterium glutamicum ZL-2]